MKKCLDNVQITHALKYVMKYLKTFMVHKNYVVFTFKS